MKSTEHKEHQKRSMLSENAQPDEIAIAQFAAVLVKEDDALSDAIKDRLANARQLSVNRFLTLQRQPQMVGVSGVFSIITHYAAQHRALTVAFAMMLVTFISVQQFGLNDNIENSDAYLLASDLPPEAFADKGFNTWIASAQN